MTVVSVLLPAYNIEKYVEATLESVSHQTFSDFEILVIDDGSTDNTSKILEQYARREPRLKVYRQENAGISAALNKGLELAAGEFIARIDGDDVMHPQRLACQVDFLRRNSEAGFCASSLDLIDAAGRVFGDYVYGPRDEKEHNAFVLEGRPLVYTHPSVMYRTALVRAAGGYKKSFEPCEDMELFLNLTSRGHHGYVLQDKLIKYRVHGGSISGSKTERQILMQEFINDRFYGVVPRDIIKTYDEYLGWRARQPLTVRLKRFFWLKSELHQRVARYKRADGKAAHEILHLCLAALYRPVAAMRRVGRSIYRYARQY